jgi:hypothetical protein
MTFLSNEEIKCVKESTLGQWPDQLKLKLSDLIAIYKYSGMYQIKQHILKFDTADTTKKCEFCKTEFTSTSGRITCSRGCAIRSANTNEDVVSKRKTSQLKTIAERKPTGFYSDISRKAYKTRFANGTYESAIEKIKASAKNTVMMRKQMETQLKRDRYHKIVQSNRLRLMLRLTFMHAKHSPNFRTFEQKIMQHRDLLPIDFDCKFEYNLAKISYKDRRYCPVCSTVLESVHQVCCSHRCSFVFTKYRRSNFTRSMWQKGKYRAKQIKSLNDRWASSTEENRKIWAEKVLETMGKEGRLRRRDAALKTKLKTGKISAIYILDEYDSLFDDYKAYRARVWLITEKNISADDNSKRGRTAFHIDHIFPISKGYRYGIPSSLMGSANNLKLLPFKENIVKSNKIQEIPETILNYITENNIALEN